MKSRFVGEYTLKKREGVKGREEPKKERKNYEKFIVGPR
jgi:hypothetical protein